MIHRFAIGIDGFQKLRELGLEYADKSSLIRDLLDRPGVAASLFPRPRRFGKTLNLSMLRAWFEKSDQDLSHLFRDLSIWQAGDAYRAHFQRYPVIYLSLKETGWTSYDLTLASIRWKIHALFHEHVHILESPRLDDRQRREFRAILDGSAETSLYARALLNLSGCLHAVHGEQVIILIDEYDEPLQGGHFYGYSDQINDLLGTFLSEGLKSNPHLFKAVMTGMLRLPQDSIFSGFNNLGVYSLLRPEMHTCFGFTEPEVEALLTRADRAHKLDEVRSWYNGYLFGGEAIYNPWSILCFLDSEEARLDTYWLSTSSNDLVKELLELYAFDLQPVFESLLRGESLVQRVEENVVLAEIRTNRSALWSLLLFSGYLKAEDRDMGPSEPPVQVLSIPNREVRSVYTGTFQRWMEARMRGHGGGVDRLTRALLTGDVEAFEDQLQAFVTNVLSYHDPGSLDPERVYQGFLVGLLAVLEPAYEVRSNRESGQGRPDVLIRPRQAGKPGIVLELKVAKPRRRTLEQALSEGLSQLAENDYGAELRATGATPVFAFAVAFDGKEVRVAAPRPRPVKKARAKTSAPKAKRAANARATVKTKVKKKGSAPEKKMAVRRR